MKKGNSFFSSDIKVYYALNLEAKAFFNWQTKSFYLPCTHTHTHTHTELGFTPCTVEQPLEGMELQEKETQKD